MNTRWRDLFELSRIPVHDPVVSRYGLDGAFDLLQKSRVLGDGGNRGLLERYLPELGRQVRIEIHWLVTASIPRNLAWRGRSRRGRALPSTVEVLHLNQTRGLLSPAALQFRLCEPSAERCRLRRFPYPGLPPWAIPFRHCGAGFWVGRRRRFGFPVTLCMRHS